jgi:AraC-like DNA-binding protein
MNMLMLASYICFLTCALGIIFSIYLLLRFRQYTATYILLALVFSLCWIEFYMFALSSRNILNMTFLFRSAFPFRTIGPVLLWLYVWKTLNPNKAFTYKQLLHLVIPIVIVIGLMPDFLQPVSYKLEMLSTFYQQNNYLMMRKTGLFPAGFIQPFLLIYGLIYIFYSIQYIAKVKKRKGEVYCTTNKILLNWITLVSIVIAVFVLLQSVQYLSLLFKGNFSFFAQIGQSLALISMKVYLLVNPNAIENMQGCLDVVDELTDQNANFEVILPKVNPDANKTACSFLQEFLMQQEGFKDPNLSLETMAEQLSISKAKLSAYLQDCFSMSFPEIINRYRIHHFIKLYKKDELKLMKVETLILQCGYRNKTTFYLAFKKVLESNPSTILKHTRK